MDRIDARDLPARLAAEPDVVALFVADWCGFCRRFLRGLPATPPAGPRLLVVDASDEDDPAWETHRLDVVPTAIRFQRGREVARANGRLGLGLSEARFRALFAPAADAAAQA